MLKSKTFSITFSLQTVYKLSHIKNERRFLALVERTPLLRVFISDPLHHRFQIKNRPLVQINDLDMKQLIYVFFIKKVTLYLINVTTIDKQYLLLHYQSTVYVQINDQIITFHLKCPSHYDSRFDWFECFQLEMAYTIKHR